MKFYCIPELKEEFLKLVGKKSYQSLPVEICRYFQDKTKEELLEGDRIFPIKNAPYIKKRLGGRGGFRIDYQLITQADGEVILLFVYPKTGKFGIPDLDIDFRKQLLRSLKLAREKDELIRVTLKNDEVQFH